MKDQKMIEVQSTMNDQDFSEVYRIYLATERGSEKKKALMTVAAFFVFFLVLLIINHNMSFLFLMLGCVIIALSYLFMPINKKFIAENKLLFGAWRETVFYEHHVTVMELFQENDAEQMSEEELREAITEIPTTMLTAYETDSGFLFADGKISRQFVYIPKRDLDETQLSVVLQFASERCSGGYHRIPLRAALHDSKTEDAEELVTGACEKYYGADKLNLYDEDGARVDFSEEDDASPEEETPAGYPHTELDVDAELERILSETEANRHGS